MSNAIVSTQRRATATIGSFLRWHIEGAGFDHVFLYLDAPEDDAETLRLLIDKGASWWALDDISQDAEAHAQLNAWEGNGCEACEKILAELREVRFKGQLGPPEKAV